MPGRSPPSMMRGEPTMATGQGDQHGQKAPTSPPPSQRPRRELWEAARLQNVHVVVGAFEARLPEVLSRAPVDYAYIDGHHDGQATTSYFDLIGASSNPGALMVLDD